MHANSSTVFVDLLDLVAEGAPGRFRAPPAPERGGRVYGGQLLAQAVVAAYRTVSDDRRLHSLHGYFLRAGDVDTETHWQVEQIRDGRSFAGRAVTGCQGDVEVFRMISSFHTPEEGFDYGPSPDYEIADLPPPEEVTLSYVDFCQGHPDLAASDWYGQDRPMDIRYINPPTEVEGVAVTDAQLTWTRLSEALPAGDHVANDAGLAYLCDATLVDHVLLPHGHRWHDARLTGASLDHAMWFLRPAPADQWLLYDQRVESTAGARGLATGRFYTAAGELIATCSQEGLVRWHGD